MPFPNFFILASTSPRRRQFLEALGIPFTVIAPGQANGVEEIDESPLANETPANLVQRLSKVKAQAVVDHLPKLYPQINQYTHAAVIAADTVVVLNGAILGKPDTPNEATKMLQHLREKPHFVYSGLTVVQPPRTSKETVISVTKLHQSKVWMRPYSNPEIRVYVASGSPMDKAGAYGIQDKIFAPVARLDGCFASVMGFPIGEFATALKEMDLSLPETPPICKQLIGQDCCFLKQ